MNIKMRIFGISLVWILGWATLVSASELQEVARLAQDDSRPNDLFGQSVALEGNLAVVSRPEFQFGGGALPGSVFVYRFNGVDWIEEQRLSASDGVNGDGFGWSVDVSGDVIVVGALIADNSRGSAYVFRFDGSTWTEEQKLTASDGESDDAFGIDVKVDGDVILIGAPGGNGSNNSAYAYRFDGSVWVEEQKLTPSNGFDAGRAIGLQGDVAILGNQTHASFRGRALVFRYDGASWNEEQQILASDGAPDDLFGSSLELEGPTLIVGASSASPDGAAYVFRFDGSTFVEEQKLNSSDTSRQFGFSVDIEGDTALVGANLTDGFVGAAYTFTFDGSTWSQSQRLSASGPGGGSLQVGADVAISGGRALVAASGEASSRGAAYIFDGPLCLAGAVNALNGSITNVVFVDGTSGGEDRTVELEDGQPLIISIQRPVTGGSGRFVLHVNQGAPGTTSEVRLPASIGRTCFPFLLASGATPIIVANCLGREPRVGESRFMATPVPDPQPATTTLFYPDFPLGTTLTVQGVILDPGAVSSLGASATNAVVVTYVP